MSNSGKLSMLWKDIRAAVSGTEQDYTSGNIGRAILLLSIPMVLEMIMESIFAIVDIFFVSKLGANAVSVVGITESMLTIVYALSGGLSTAAVAIIARRTGEKNISAASKSAAQALILGISVSAIISVAGFIFAENLLRAMGASNDVINEGIGYTQIALGSNFIIMLLFINNAIFRSSGDAALSMRVLILGNLINIILDPILIFGLGPIPAFGVQGAAMATATGRGIAVLYQFYLLFFRDNKIKISLKDFIPDFALMGNMAKLAMGGVGQSIIATSSWIGMMRIVSEYGSNAVAGYTIAIRIVIFCLLPSWGLSNAAATLTGQNLGAQRPDRAEKSVWITSYINMIVLGFTAIVFIIFSAGFISFFINDTAVIQSGAICLRIISIGLVSYALGMVMIQALNGAGDTSTPTLIFFVCFWLIEIPLAWILAIKAGYKEEGVYISILIAETIMTIIGLIIFKSGKWKTKRV